MVSGLSGVGSEVVPRLVEEVSNEEVENATILPLLVEDETAREHHFNLSPAISTVVQVSRDVNDSRFVITSAILNARERKIFAPTFRFLARSFAKSYHQLKYRQMRRRRPHHRRKWFSKLFSVMFLFWRGFRLKTRILEWQDCFNTSSNIREIKAKLWSGQLMSLTCK